MRAHDAAAGAPSERVPTSGGVSETEFAADAFGARRRRVRLSGRDQETGEHFGAELYLPTGGHGFGSGPARVGDAVIGADALDNLERPRDGCEEISAIAELQRRLNAHYGQ
jgi:hypothetical protein